MAGRIEFAVLTVFDCLLLLMIWCYTLSSSITFAEKIMSKQTGSQMEAALLDRIEKAKEKLGKLQQKHKLEIGALAYKHGLHQFNIKQLDHVFAKIASEVVES